MQTGTRGSGLQLCCWDLAERSRCPARAGSLALRAVPAAGSRPLRPGAWQQQDRLWVLPSLTWWNCTRILESCILSGSGRGKPWS